MANFIQKNNPELKGFNRAGLYRMIQFYETYANVQFVSIDLKDEFPDMGLSPRNLWDMKRFYERYYLADQKLRQPVAVLPWGHNLLLLSKIDSFDDVQFYANEVLAKVCTRDLLLKAIKMDVYSRADNRLKSHNYADTLPESSAEYANELFKSSYNLGFLGTCSYQKWLIIIIFVYQL